MNKNMITEDYVSFETAKLLKEKGFPQNPYICNTAYTLRGKFSNNAKSFVHNFAEFDKCGIKPLTYSMAPTLQMALKWLREVHNLWIALLKDADYGWKYKPQSMTVLREERFDCSPFTGYYSTYEQACEAAIKYCLENLITPSLVPEQ